MDDMHPRPNSKKAKPQTVGLVLQNDYPHDAEIRMTRLIAANRGRGIRTIVFCRGQGNGPSEEETPWGAIVRLYGRATSPLPWNPRWHAWLSRQVARHRPDLLVASNIGIGTAAAAAARRARVPFILDLQENNPAAVRVRDIRNLRDRVVRQAWLVRFVERFICRASDEVWVVAAENRDRIVRDYRLDGPVHVVGNTPVPVGKDLVASPTSRRPLRLVYVGQLDRFRGVDYLMRALADAPGQYHLVVVGDGPHRPTLETLAQQLGIASNVDFTGWRPWEEASRILAACDVGALLHVSNEHTETTLPNKLFDYMMQGLPVLAGPTAPIARIVRETGCGIVSKSLEPADVLAALQELARGGALQRFSAAGRKAALERYNWNVDGALAMERIEAHLDTSRKDPQRSARAHVP